MTSYDYQYRRRRRSTRRSRRPQRPPARTPLSRVAFLNMLLGLALGFAAALFYAWVLRPVDIDNSTPAALQPVFQDDYLLLIAETYNADRNLEAAIARLDTLQLPNANASLIQLTEQKIATDGDRNDIRRLVGLAAALEIVTPPMEPFLP